MVLLYSLSIEHVNVNIRKWNFPTLSRIYLSILSVNFNNVCFIYAEIFEKMSSGGLEISFSIHENSNYVTEIPKLSCVAKENLSLTACSLPQLVEKDGKTRKKVVYQAK